MKQHGQAAGKLQALDAAKGAASGAASGRGVTETHHSADVENRKSPPPLPCVCLSFHTHGNHARYRFKCWFSAFTHNARHSTSVECLFSMSLLPGPAMTKEELAQSEMQKFFLKKHEADILKVGRKAASPPVTTPLAAPPSITTQLAAPPPVTSALAAPPPVTPPLAAPPLVTLTMAATPHVTPTLAAPPPVTPPLAAPPHVTPPQRTARHVIRHINMCTGRITWPYFKAFPRMGKAIIAADTPADRQVGW